MPIVSITGKDTLVLNGHVFHGLADGDCGKLVYEDDLTKLKVGKEGNAVFGQNQLGRAGTLSIRVVMGSADDKYLNGLIANYLSDSSGYVLDIGSLFKQVGDGKGNRNAVVYQFVGGAPKKQPEVAINADGDPGQVVAEYTWLIAQVARSIQ